MGHIVLNEIPFQVNQEQLFKKLRIDDKPSYAERAKKLVEEAQAVAKPKAMYKESFVEERGEDFVVVDGIKLESHLLRVNLADIYKVYPYIATCGVEIEEWSKSIEDMLESFWADTIKEMALASARQALTTYFKEHTYQGQTSTMNPGSLGEWPISEQKNLFALLGDPKKIVGVELQESFLMTPVKSVSGIRFATEVHFENCQLCSKERCPGRKAPYDKDLYDLKYSK